MPELNPFTRREFLCLGLAIVSTLGSEPTFLNSAGTALASDTSRTASKAGVPEDRVFVVIQLSGGNDGLNTVVPYGADAYHKARPGFGIKPKQALKIDENQGIGLHPSMKEIHELLQDEQASVVQGVGYPNPNRSHFASMDVWQTGDTRGREDEGWISRAMEQHQNPEAHGMEVIALDRQAPFAVQGETTQPVTFRNPWTLHWSP